MLERLLHERIRAPFTLEGRSWSVASQQACLGWQGHDAANRGFKVAMVGIGQIRAPDRAADDQVAPDEQFLAGTIITNVSRRMAGGMDHSELESSERELLIMAHMLIHFERSYPEGQAEQPGLQIRVLGFPLVGAMEQNLCFRTLGPNLGVVRKM